MSKLAGEKYNAEVELSLIKLSIPDPLIAEAYKELLRDLERHDLGICDDRRTAIRVKGADVKVKMFLATHMVKMQQQKIKND